MLTLALTACAVGLLTGVTTLAAATTARARTLPALVTAACLVLLLWLLPPL